MDFIKKNWPMFVGILVIAVGIFMLFHTNDLKKKCTEETMAKVVEIKEVEDYDSETYSTNYTYYPVVEYTASGRTVAKESSSSVDKNKYKIGDEIKIFYNPNNVEQFIIDGDISGNMIGIIAILGGLLFFAVGFVPFMQNNNKKVKIENKEIA